MYIDGGLKMGAMGAVLSVASQLFQSQQKSREADKRMKFEEKRYSQRKADEAEVATEQRAKEKSILQKSEYQDEKKRKQFLSGSSILG